MGMMWALGRIELGLGLRGREWGRDDMVSGID